MDYVLEKVFWHDWVFQIANAFLMLSYIQTNFLYLRIMVMFSNVAFICWGWFSLDVALDLIIWN